MVKVADLVKQVEYVKEGWSDAHTPKEWKETFAKRREESKLPEDMPSPTREALGKLQDNGLSQKMGELQKVDIVGKV